ncbi:MAG: hypothetical protein LBK73_13240 [Treponema sp.]|nr:hypothetical protein [Treponema sp.]
MYEYRDVLAFEFERPLTSEPLRIDAVVVKKKPGVEIKKGIASIFKGHNIVEFKSPEDSLGVGDFHKVMAYAHLYSAMVAGVEASDVTVTFVVTKRPREVLKYVREVYGYRVEERWSGVYIITGDALGMQIIESKKLRAEENVWLKSLREGVGREEVEEVFKAGKEMKGWGAPMKAYMYMFMKANYEQVKEVMKMSDMAVLDTLFEEVGLASLWMARGEKIGEARGEARGEKIGEARGEKIGEARGEKIGEAQGEEKKARMVARKLINNGFTVEKAAEYTGLDVEKIRALRVEDSPPC